MRFLLQSYLLPSTSLLSLEDAALISVVGHVLERRVSSLFLRTSRVSHVVTDLLGRSALLSDGQHTLLRAIGACMLTACVGARLEFAAYSLDLDVAVSESILDHSCSLGKVRRKAELG